VLPALADLAEVAARRVWERPVEHSMGELSIRTGTEQTAACWRSVDAAARSARAAGDLRSAGQSRSAARPWILTNLTMAAETYLGLDDRPAILHSDTAGPIPLPAHIARALARDPEGAFLRRVLTAPATGVAWDVSRHYRAPAAMAEFVKVRDGYRSRLPISGDANGVLEIRTPAGKRYLSYPEAYRDPAWG
jgi:hypothetical protein